MGFFKDIKKARDVAASARETAAEHGGMPSLREGLSDAAKALDDRGEREILKTGVAMKGLSDASDGRFGAGVEADMMDKMMKGEPITLPTPGAISAGAAAAGDPQARLAKLEQLKQDGLIDDAEYQAKRRQIIDSI